MCIAAYLSLLGQSTAAAGAVAPLVFPVGVALVALSVAAIVYVTLRRRDHERR